VSDYNYSLNDDQELEKIKTYQLVPQAAKATNPADQYISLSFVSMMAFFWEFQYYNKYSNDYRIQTGQVKEMFVQGSKNAPWRIAESLFNMRNPKLDLP
jgi:hypothetical protein